MIYLDNAATTKPYDKVVSEMCRYLTDEYGNPGSLYSIGRSAAEAVDNARKSVGKFLNCNKKHIIFTAGGSDGNNAVFKMLEKYMIDSGKTTIVTSDVEHSSINNAVNALVKNKGFNVRFVSASHNGSIDIDDLSSAIDDTVGVVSIMYENNETGAVNDVKEIAMVCHEHGVLFHTDAVQAASSRPIDVTEIGCDFLTISGHKIHAPKGVGALYVKSFDNLTPYVYGGNSQEMGYRGGTENVPGIVGIGEACRIIMNRRKDGIIDNVRFLSMKRNLLLAMKNQLPGCLDKRIHVFGGDENGDMFDGKTMSVRFDGVQGEALMMMLDTVGVMVSTGSACNGHSVGVSRTLLNSGLTEEQAMNTIRISVSDMTSPDDVEEAGTLLGKCVKALMLS